MKYQVKPNHLNAEQVRALLELTREQFPEYRYITMHGTGMMLFMPLDDSDVYIHWLEFATKHLLQRMYKTQIEAHGTAFMLTKLSDLLMSKDPISFLTEERKKIK